MIEALVALLLTMGGVLALMSVAASTINQVSQTKYRNDASDLTSEIIGQMYANWDGVGTAYNHAAWDARVAATLPGGAVDTFNITAMPSGPQVDIKLSWKDKTMTHVYLTSTMIAK